MKGMLLSTTFSWRRFAITFTKLQPWVRICPVFLVCLVQVHISELVVIAREMPSVALDRGETVRLNEQTVPSTTF